MASDREQLAAARLRAAEARARLGLTVGEITSNLTPVALASSAISRVRAGGGTDWLTAAFKIYRYRGTAMTILGALAALKARKRRKRRQPVSNNDEGVATVASNRNNGAGEPAQGRIRQVAGSAARKAAEARASAGEKASTAYNYSRTASTRITHRIASGVQEHPLSVVLGVMAVGAVAAVFLPRIRSAAARTSEALPIDELRDKAAQTARETFHAIGDRLDELGINRENARDVVSRVRDVALDAATAAQDAIHKARRDH